MNHLLSPARLSDDALLVEVQRLAASERASTARLITALAEVDARRLYLGQGCSSLFVYCTRVLRLSEHAAYGRIEAARASRRFPVLLPVLERGELTLTSVALLAPHLDVLNHIEVLGRARFRSKREVEEIVAALRPQPDAPTVIRRIADIPIAAGAAAVPRDGVHSEHTATHSSATPAKTALGCDEAAAAPSGMTHATATQRSKVALPAVQPLSPERYKLQVTINAVTWEKLRRAQDLMRHSIPAGELASILDRAVDLLLADIERTRLAAVAKPRAARPGKATSRRVSSDVRRAVWRRDQGRCAFTGAGRRCRETAFLEFHHVRPFEAGGEATVDNIELRCRAHNQYEADLFVGEEFIVRECTAPYSVRTEPTAAAERSKCGRHTAAVIA
jgi:hypothetical protein